MPLRSPRLPLSIAALLLLLAAGALAQTAPPAAAPQPASDQPAFTLHTGTRLVLTDVTVADRAGNPVHNLPATAFHLFDGNLPQTIASFEEHSASPAALEASADISTLPRGAYNNDFLLHPPPVLDVMVLDITNLALEDQMYLSYQLGRFLDALPAGQQLAVYERAGLVTVLLQNFTADHKLLHEAVRRALPRFPPTGREFISDLAMLGQISTYMTGLPGRKNILWFSGGSTLFLKPDAIAIADQAATRRIYDTLEANRIAIFPIDARGLDTGIGERMRLMTEQHLRMADVAHATGGEAFYNTNGLELAAARITAFGADFYTLTYSPRDYREDRKWHSVRIALDTPGYTLSYRRGYFADGVNNTPAAPPHAFSQLLAGGAALPGQPPGSARAPAAPLLFEARVLPSSDPALGQPSPISAQGKPSPPKRGGIPYTVRYTVPADSLTLSTANGKPALKLVVAAFAFNQSGTVVDRRVEQIILSVNPGKLEANPHIGIPIDGQLQLVKGQLYLLLALIDEGSGRSGNLQIALDVPAPPKAQK